jgi:hypothetical protein
MERGKLSHHKKAEHPRIPVILDLINTKMLSQQF